MANLSVSEQLFHFTGFDKTRGAFKPDAEALYILQQILRSHQLRLSPNRIHRVLPNGIDILREIDTTVSMACLTETPLPFIKGHIAKYGKFGLGFTVEWALRNGGQNVVYCDQSALNSYVHTIASIGGYFIRNGAGHNPQMVNWIVELVAITEDFKLREEREWRFLRGSLTYNEFRAVEFSSEDLKTIVCPQKYISDIQLIVQEHGFNPDIVPTEDYWKD